MGWLLQGSETIQQSPLTAALELCTTALERLEQDWTTRAATPGQVLDAECRAGL